MTLAQKEAFFARIASRVDYLNPEIVEQVYRELIRVIILQLREDKTLLLPDLGRFELSWRGWENAVHVRTKEKIQKGPHLRMKFKPDYKLVDYWKQYGLSNEGRIVKLKDKLSTEIEGNVVYE